MNVLLMILALLTGRCLAGQGVLTGQARINLSMQLWRWHILARTLQFRDDKFYFQAVVVTA